MSVAAYCGYCGKDRGASGHVVCDGRLELEPPRFCPSCARRMKVQVIPRGWTAECVEHGVISSD